MLFNAVKLSLIPCLIQTKTGIVINNNRDSNGTLSSLTWLFSAPLWMWHASPNEWCKKKRSAFGGRVCLCRALTQVAPFDAAPQCKQYGIQTLKSFTAKAWEAPAFRYWQLKIFHTGPPFWEHLIFYFTFKLRGQKLVKKSWSTVMTQPPTAESTVKQSRFPGLPMKKSRVGGRSLTHWCLWIRWSLAWLQPLKLVVVPWARTTGVQGHPHAWHSSTACTDSGSAEHLEKQRSTSIS